MDKGAVLVHCYFGVSRSATVVIAYIMKKYGLSYSEAFEKVKAKRSIVYPNQGRFFYYSRFDFLFSLLSIGFVTQLRLYKEMGYTIDTSNMKYKIFRLNMAADRVRKVKILPQNFVDLIQPDPGLPQSQPDPNVYRSVEDFDFFVLLLPPLVPSHPVDLRDGTWGKIASLSYGCTEYQVLGVLGAQFYSAK